MPRPNPTRPYTIPGFRICLVREPGVALAEKPALRTPAEAARIVADYISDADREQFVVSLLTVRHRLIGLHTVSVGCLTNSLVHPRECFKPAILAGAAAVILAHNHPSGDPEPSADVSLTRRLVAAGTLLGIEVLDHLIVGEHGRFVSRKYRGRYEPDPKPPSSTWAGSLPRRRAIEALAVAGQMRDSFLLRHHL